MNKVKKIRSDIMEILFKIEDEQTLKLIHSQIELVKSPDNEESIPLFMEGVKPIQYEVSLEEMMNTQQYRPISYDEFRAKADDIEWEESLEDLLAVLNK